MSNIHTISLNIIEIIASLVSRDTHRPSASHRPIAFEKKRSGSDIM